MHLKRNKEVDNNTHYIMKRFFLNILGILLFVGVADAQSPGKDTGFTPLPKPGAGEEVATFGGGCFWSMSEAMSELKGVNKVISGYAGGTT
ncbi:MAG TPA: peptide-methionine (S)-S-oxide reductase, partial [Puia sp.]|nr:peptide-methionine (S)-S-oxide reductase [Puia sp.]